MNPNIHLATESDADTLLTLMREYYTFDGHSFDPPKAHEALLGLLRDPSFGRAWIVLLDATVIGYIVLCFGYSLEYHGRDSFLDEFYLKEDYRRRGIGQRVLQLVEEEAGSLGIRSIHLEVVRRNEAAAEFYRKAGYRDHQHRLMTKPLFALN
jgi:ribosomal protein S18 acetylase RimI-like enzyme